MSRLFLIITIILSACSGNYSEPDAPQGNAVYYWRTSFSLSGPEREFLKDNDVKAFYVHFFDVVIRDGELVPDATLKFTKPFPDGIEIIPTVFIDSHALGNGVRQPSGLPKMLLSRVDSMMTQNGYPLSREVQLDFDWTERNREQFFGLLSKIRTMLQAQNRRLSVTIRLHQLSQPAPPADYGSLMVYNIGRFSSPEETNSILSTKALRPYLRYLKDYDLPLATALPVYSWDLLFRNDHFLAIARGVDCNDTALFTPVGANRYAARHYMPLPSSSSGPDPGMRILPGDIIRHEQISTALLDTVVTEIDHVRPGALGRIILYHLDQQSLSKYTDNEINQLYHRP